MGSPNKTSSPSALQPILDYISQSWNVLTRTTAHSQGISDPKLISHSVLYLPAGMAIDPALQKFMDECKVRVLHLPAKIQGPGEKGLHGEIHPPGLLYLPHPYVVPGGRFNEMYAWDSYFIICGLLRCEQFELARGMVENLFFEIENYGAVLNANRTYYLTRSQQPFLSSMVKAIYEGGHDRQWLARAAKYIATDYAMWTTEPHLAGSTGLSRYYDFGEGPVPEGLHDETGYYTDVVEFLLSQDRNSPYLVPHGQSPTRHLHAQNRAISDASSRQGSRHEKFDLSPEAYKGDRSQRESGFDISFRFGPFSLATHHYAPVCLNSLLYKTEQDMADISTVLGDARASAQWRERAAARGAAMNKLLWSADRGLFFDFNFTTNERSSYEYATTFYPLWVSLASPQQAASVRGNLHLFEQAGGIAMSRFDSGAQWDYPFGWAPIHLLAVESLRRYQFAEDAARVAFKFLEMVWKNFQKDGAIREKYNVVNDTSLTQVREGYHMNVVGFGWTNAVFLELLQSLPADLRQRLEAAR